MNQSEHIDNNDYQCANETLVVINMAHLIGLEQALKQLTRRGM